MDLLSLNKLLYQCTKKLDEARKDIIKQAKEFAESEKDYTISMAAATIKLKETEKATHIDRLAKGECYKEKYRRDLAEQLLKAYQANAKSLQAEMTALQSLLKYQNEMGE